MKALFLFLSLLAAALPALAQTDVAGKDERARIGAEREQAEARFKAKEVECYRKFAVNDCLKAARSERRERLTELRRQEQAINDAERKRKAAERLSSVEERNSVQAQEQAQASRDKAVARQIEKKEELDKRAAERAKPPARAASRAVKPAPVHDTAGALQQSEQRQKEAKERQERVAKRQAEAAAKGPVRPLPVPP